MRQPTFDISIHTPHAGSDAVPVHVFGDQLQISIHTPHAGSDFSHTSRERKLCEFQSTLPMRGVTCACISNVPTSLFQSTLPMRGVTLVAIQISVQFAISIHTPHAGSDEYEALITQRANISIHTPHAGSDDTQYRDRKNYRNFNPHSPCGE